MLLEPSNGSNYQACAALTSLPDPVWAYIHFKVNIVEEKGSLTINKVDAETGKALAGVTYRLFDANGKKVADMTTGADGKAVFKDLPQGKYSYQEISAPSGYVVDNTKYQITIMATALNITQKRTNTPAKASIEIVKVDADHKTPLQGVGFRLYDASGRQVTEGYTDANGKLTFSNLRLGSYTYKEFKAPDGYVLDTTAYSAVLNQNGQVLKVTRENVPAKGSITVRKVDVTGSPLAGAELVLETSTDGKSWTEVSRITTDNTGSTKWNDLKVGAQYRVTETKAPAGYTLLTEPLFTGVLDSRDRDVTITACNNAGFALPFTGGTGFTTYFLFAALMLCMGVYFCKKSARRKTAG